MLRTLGRFFVWPGQERALSDRFVEQLDIRTSSRSQLSGTLSGGNQQKIVLSKTLATDPKIIILDEPTRGIDARARQDVYRIIRDLTGRGVAVLLISSELGEIVDLSDRVLVMYRGRVEELAAPEHRLRRKSRRRPSASSTEARHDPDPQTSRGRGHRAAGRCWCWSSASFSPNFLQPAALINVANSSLVLMLIAIGEMFVILTRGIDVSVGAITGISAVILGTSLNLGVPLPIAIVLALLAGLGAGMVNAVGVTIFRVPPIIMTLGTLGVYRGMMLLITGGSWIETIPQSIKSSRRLAIRRSAVSGVGGDRRRDSHRDCAARVQAGPLLLCRWR